MFEVKKPYCSNFISNPYAINLQICELYFCCLQVCYAALVLTLTYEAILACKNYPPIKPLVLTSLVLYLFGFFLWNLDNVFCSSLRLVGAL